MDVSTFSRLAMHISSAAAFALRKIRWLAINLSLFFGNKTKQVKPTNGKKQFVDNDCPEETQNTFHLARHKSSERRLLASVIHTNVTLYHRHHQVHVTCNVVFNNVTGDAADITRNVNASSTNKCESLTYAFDLSSWCRHYWLLLMAEALRS